MAKKKKRLPEYDSPPVDEVALGVSFAPIGNFKIPHFGLYWNDILSAFPRCEAHPPVPFQVEPVQIQPEYTSGFQFSSDVNAVRCWFLDETGNNLIQLQPDRFILNWRQVGDGGQEYPRYSSLRPSFESEWNRFSKFLLNKSFDLPQVIQCEVTYVNNIVRGTTWDTFADLPNVVTFWNGMTSAAYLAAPESASIGLAYAMDNPSDRLRVSLQHAFRIRDGKDILQLNLVARMKMESGKTEDILACFDRGHDWIVRAFTDFTTPKMHKIWKRRV